MQVHPTLESIEDVMASLYQAVDSRVFVAVGRGLWDCASQDVYDYLEGPQEGLRVNKVQQRCLSMQPYLSLLACVHHIKQTQVAAYQILVCIVYIVYSM